MFRIKSKPTEGHTLEWYFISVLYITAIEPLIQFPGLMFSHYGRMRQHSTKMLDHIMSFQFLKFGHQPPFEKMVKEGKTNVTKLLQWMTRHEHLDFMERETIICGLPAHA
jgi:hypothetical protein